MRVVRQILAEGAERMTLDDLQALRPGDVVEFRNWSAGGKNPYRPAVVVGVEGERVRLRLANGLEIVRTHYNLRKEGVKT